MSSKFYFLVIVVFVVMGYKNKNSSKASDLRANDKDYPVKKTYIDSLMRESYDRGVFNGNILVAKGNNIIYQNEFGYSDA